MRQLRTIVCVPFQRLKEAKRDLGNLKRRLLGKQFCRGTSNKFLDFGKTSVKAGTDALRSYTKSGTDAIMSYIKSKTVTTGTYMVPLSGVDRNKNVVGKPLKIAIFGKRNIDNLSVVRSVKQLVLGSEFQTKDAVDSHDSSYAAFSFLGRELNLVVAPWLQDKDLSETTAGEVTIFVLNSLPGLSSLILTLNLNDLHEVPYIVRYYEAVFGKSVVDYSILAFICDCEDANESRLKHALKELKDIIKAYKSRVVVISQGKKDNKSALQIIKHNDAIMKNNDGKYFRNDTFEKVEEIVRGVLLSPSKAANPGIKRKSRVSRFRTRGADVYIVRLLHQIRQKQLSIKRLILNNTGWTNNIARQLLPVIIGLILKSLISGNISFGF
ncbi:hypothetical protein CHS0354_037803 [Potamilus streckersoni]|uniref:AIG1-type G domain-containing protein n=1 Tax=Potamilus streckersoni TaxID=2493646 RepID=A0AAE0VYH4_9BIVA|nr:hypothetical protein CHS0354_037803 [Potamilus streckersoni]